MSSIFFLSRLAEMDVGGGETELSKMRSWARTGARSPVSQPFFVFLFHTQFPQPLIPSPTVPLTLLTPDLLLFHTRFPAVFSVESLRKFFLFNSCFFFWNVIQIKFLPLSSLRKAPLGESGILPHLLLGLGKSLSVLRVCSLKRQYLRMDNRRVEAPVAAHRSQACCGHVGGLTGGVKTKCRR